MELFGTAGIRGDARNRVTPSLALAVGSAAGADGDEFVVGRDGRTTGPALADAVAAGLASAGARVVRVGLVPTPAVAYTSRSRRGVVVTASHNPPSDNGLKLFVDGEEYDREAERRVERRLDDADTPVRWTEWGTTERVDVLDDYRETVARYARVHGSDPGGLRVAVDCGTGASALATPQVLRSLGADVVALNAQVDGHFPGRPSKPTPESVVDLRAFVASDGPAGDETTASGGFDLGIAHDGDADRVVVVDGAGEVVHEDTVVAILAEHFVRADGAGDPVVLTTPNASERIDERVRAAGGRVERVGLGALHEGIASVRGHGDGDTRVVFAAEPWKHLHPDLGPWIDGVASAAVLVRLVGERGLDALREPVTERPYRKLSVPCDDARKGQAMDELEETLPESFPDAAASMDHGVRLAFPDGSWLLARPSGTEPYVRLYAESDEVDDLVERARRVVEAAI